jgi:hypothetical protein
MIEDPVLGLLEWHEELRYWRGSLTLASGRTALLDITPATDKQADNPDSPEVFAAAHLIVAWLRASEAAAYGIVSRAMLKLYNDIWSDEPPISAEEFASRIELVDVSMLSDGKTFTLWFTDGAMEIFGGHIIEASFGADDQLRSADLAG